MSESIDVNREIAASVWVKLAKYLLPALSLLLYCSSAGIVIAVAATVAHGAEGWLPYLLLMAVLSGASMLSATLSLVLWSELLKRLREIGAH